METAFIETLDDITGRYVREALADTSIDNDAGAQLAGLSKQAAEAARDVEAGASLDIALSFKREVDSFLTAAKAKALEARRIEASIEAKQLEVAQAQAEIERLSASMAALAEAVNKALDRCEEVRHDYNANEFKIANVSTRLSMRRGELADMRRRLAQIKGQEV